MRIKTSFVHIALVLAVLLTAAGTASAQLYGGRATGLVIRVNSGAEERVADTGELPGTGGAASSSALLYSGLGGSLTAGPLNSTVSGVLRSSQATSTVNNFVFSVGGVTISAPIVTANAGCICCPPVPPSTELDPTCSGSTRTGIVITSGGTATGVVVTGDPNQPVMLPNGLGTLIINEQTTSPLGISVTGLHIQAAFEGTTYDIRVAQARASIDCTATAPSAGPVTVDGRVVSATGRPIFRAVVSLTNKAGTVYSATTNSMGYFAIREVPSGETYILNVTHRQYTFNPQAIGLNENLTVNITAN